MDIEQKGNAKVNNSLKFAGILYGFRQDRGKLFCKSPN